MFQVSEKPRWAMPWRDPWHASFIASSSRATCCRPTFWAYPSTAPSSTNSNLNRARFKFEFVELGAVDGYAQNVGRQQVARELDAMKLACQGSRQGIAQRGFSDTWNIFDQQMTLCQKGDDRQLDRLLFAFYCVSD